jgi:hypothetical protein
MARLRSEAPDQTLLDPIALVFRSFRSLHFDGSVSRTLCLLVGFVFGVHNGGSVSRTLCLLVGFVFGVRVLFSAFFTVRLLSSTLGLRRPLPITLGLRRGLPSTIGKVFLSRNYRDTASVSTRGHLFPHSGSTSLTCAAVLPFIQEFFVPLLQSPNAFA